MNYFNNEKKNVVEKKISAGRWLIFNDSTWMEPGGMHVVGMNSAIAQIWSLVI